MYQKLSQLLAHRIWLYFAAMLSFAGVTALLGHRDAAAAEFVVVAALLAAFAASG